jgi:hypothetical protein
MKIFPPLNMRASPVDWEITKARALVNAAMLAMERCLAWQRAQRAEEGIFRGIVPPKQMRLQSIPKVITFLADEKSQCSSSSASVRILPYKPWGARLAFRTITPVWVADTDG